VERDLDRLATRSDTPFLAADETKRLLREEVFPFWRGRQVFDRLMEVVPADQWRADERGVLYHYFRSRTIGHINAGYDKVLSQGLDGIRGNVARALEALDSTDPAAAERRIFLESVALVCDAVVSFARRHADAARLAAAGDVDPARRDELLRVAAVCERVPAAPARSFHEALPSFWFTHLALNLESRVLILRNGLERAPGHGPLRVRLHVRRGQIGSVVRVIDDRSELAGMRGISGAEGCGGQGSPVLHLAVPVGMHTVSAVLSDSRVAQKKIEVGPSGALVTLDEGEFER